MKNCTTIVFAISLTIVSLFCFFYKIENANKTESCIIFKPTTAEYHENLNLLTKLIQSESGTENFIDKLYVGSVVLNWMRIKDRCMHDVIFKPNKFSGVNGSGFRHDPESERAAKILLNYGPIDTSVIYFLNPAVSTNRKWVHQVMQREMVFKNTNHIFYK